MQRPFVVGHKCPRLAAFNRVPESQTRPVSRRAAKQDQATQSSNTLDARAVRRREKEEGRSTYRPESYKELVSHAVESIDYALEDGCKRMEVDFPTLAGDSKTLS